MKGAACRRVGLGTRKVELAEETTTERLLSVIDGLNRDPEVYGILLQHPVPRQIDERACFDAIAADKDVDGVTATGFGRMALGEDAFVSATPGGILRLLKHYRLPLEGKRAVVIGRSAILANRRGAALGENATVTDCHQDPGLARLSPKPTSSCRDRQAGVRHNRLDQGRRRFTWTRLHPAARDVEKSAYAKSYAYTPSRGGGPIQSTLMAQTGRPRREGSARLL
jgi:hypothetical protein